jgi:hypothetical protein
MKNYIMKHFSVELPTGDFGIIFAGGGAHYVISYTPAYTGQHFFKKQYSIPIARRLSQMVLLFMQNR